VKAVNRDIIIFTISLFIIYQLRGHFLLSFIYTELVVYPLFLLALIDFTREAGLAVKYCNKCKNILK
jgi:hypothetical protein